MPKNNSGVQRSVVEQIEELKAKLALLEGDRKAYCESSVHKMTQNKKRIADLRKENASLRKELKDRLSADDHVINQAFQNRPKERAALSNKTGRDAITTMDYKVCDSMKRLNALKHVSEVKRKRLEELEQSNREFEKEQANIEATEAGLNKEGQHLRDLENRLDKASLKCHEAEHIRKTYEQIKAKLQEEHMTFGNTLDSMEAEIAKCRKENEDLEVMHEEAQRSRDAALEEFKMQESIVQQERRKRESDLNKLKKEADEKKLQHEKIEKRLAQRSSMQNEDLDGRHAGHGSEEQQQKITTYEEAFKQIKEATGVSDLKEVVARFENQGETREHLEELKRESEKQIQRLRAEKESLQAVLEEMKYSGEAKLSSGQRILEQYQKTLQEEEARRDSIQERLDRASKVLVQCKAGVEHLSEKLTHIKTAKSSAAPQAQVSPSSDEYVLDLLGKCEEKLLKLMQDLDKYDLNEQLKEMKTEENVVLIGPPDSFHVKVECKLPAYNTRIKMPQMTKDNAYDDDDESGDDEGEVLTRAALKKQCQMLVDLKTKKRQPKKKKKGK